MHNIILKARPFLVGCLLDTIKSKTSITKKFYRIENIAIPKEDNNSIEAIVDANQFLANGAIIELSSSINIFIMGV